MPRTAVVADSTARPVPDGVHVVDLDVVLDGVPVREVDTSTAEVLAAVAAGATVSTSRPSPDGFARAYAAAAAAGASAVVSVHLSGALSGTVEAARLAAAEAPLRVEVVDTAAVGAVVSAATAAACRTAADGADVRRVAGAARAVAGLARTWVSPATSVHLQRGGRAAGGAEARGGLSARPLLVVADGRLVPHERARTTGRVLDRLRDLVAERLAELAADGTARVTGVVVQHVGAEQTATDLVERLSRLRALQERPGAPPSPEAGSRPGGVLVPGLVSVRPLSPVLAAHVGPGAVGVAVLAAPVTGPGADR